MRTQKRIDAQCSPHLLRLLSALVFLVIGASSHAGSNGVRDTDASRISVTAVAGDVDVTMAGEAVAVTPDATVLLPARIVTGNDGNLGLTQAGTHINVANDTDVEIPAEAVDGNLIARLVQHRGNVFYDVAPRDLGKLRVETPLLVAVIKGTQFNVAVQEDSTTISLFEGRLEIRTPNGSEVVQLNAGEIAIRSRVDNSIRVVGMDDERVAAPAAARPAGAAAAAAAVAADGRLDVDDAALTARIVLREEAASVPSDSVATQVSLKPALDGGAIDELVGVGAGGLDVGLDAGLDLGAAAVGVGLDAGVDLGAAAVDVGLDAGVDLGAAAVDVGLDAGVDLGAGTVDLGLDTGVDLGAAVVDTGLDAGLDLGGALDVGLDAGADVGVVDTSLDAGVTLDTATVDVGLDAGVDLGVVDAGLDVDLGSGGLDVDLDLGLGGDAAPEPPSGGLGGLLGGLL